MLKAITSLIESVIREAEDFVNKERKSALEAKSLASKTSNAEIARLRQQNTLLTRLVESEHAASERATNEVVLQVAEILAGVDAAREERLKEVTEKVREGNDGGETDLLEFERKHNDIADNMVVRGKEVLKALEKKGAEGKKTKQAALTVGRFIVIQASH